MTARARKRVKSRTKVKRKSLYPKSREKKPKVRRLEWVPTREKPIKQAPKKLPYFRDRAPKYAPAQPHQPPAKPSGGFFKTIITIIVVIILIYVAWTFIAGGDDGGDGGGGSGCPTTCNGAAIVIAPQCICPSDSTYRDTISGGYHQCICR